MTYEQRLAREAERQRRKRLGLPKLESMKRTFADDDERRANNRAWQRQRYARLQPNVGVRTATKAKMAERYDGLYKILSESHPMTVRQVFCQATVKGVIEKTE